MSVSASSLPLLINVFCLLHEQEAELEKAKAGENRAVEHVALYTDRGSAPSSSASANSASVKGRKKRAAASGDDDALLLSGLVPPAQIDPREHGQAEQVKLLPLMMMIAQ